jgi:hypothetical protein
MLDSKIVNKADCDTDWYRNLVTEIKEKPKYHRKQWEFVMIATALEERGKLGIGNTGIGFGVGTEPLTALFANRGCKILATDQAMTTANAKKWTSTAQICSNIQDLNSRGICDKENFANSVQFLNVDMNFVPANLGKFSFLWSSCALEHLGTLQHGLWFIMRTLELLKPGGVAVHTTEFNLSSDTDTNFVHEDCIYRKQDLKLLEKVVNAAGYTMAPLNFARGTHEFDKYVDPGGRFGYHDGFNGPHLNLKIGKFDATSILLIITKNTNG